MSIKFEFEWEDPGSAKGEELRATWARLSILVNDCPVTRLVDRSSRAERSGIYVPLFPLAEWFVQNWFFLFSEVGSRHTCDRNYFARHSIRYAGEGFTLPELRLFPAGEVLSLQWRRSRPTNHVIEFIEAGEATFPITEAKAAVSGFVEAVLDRLASESVSAKALEEEWKATQSLSEEEIEFARAAASLGVDPFDATPWEEQMIVAAASCVPSEVLPELLAVTRPKDVGEQIKWFNEAVDALSAQKSSLVALPDLARSSQRIPFSMERPFERGLQVARHVREELGINGHPVVGLESLARLFGSFDDFGDSGVVLEPDADQKIHAVAMAEGAPKFLLTKERADSRRFALGRGIYNYLVHGFETVDIVADSYFVKDKASRAFAAELLAPSEGLRARVESDVVDEDRVNDLAEEFDVSTQVIENQLRNNAIAEIARG